MDPGEIVGWEVAGRWARKAICPKTHSHKRLQMGTWQFYLRVS